MKKPWRHCCLVVAAAAASFSSSSISYCSSTKTSLHSPALQRCAHAPVVLILLLKLPAADGLPQGRVAVLLHAREPILQDLEYLHVRCLVGGGGVIYPVVDDVVEDVGVAGEVVVDRTGLEDYGELSGGDSVATSSMI